MKKDFYREDFTDWLTRLVKKGRPPRGIIAYYVGLFESPDGGCVAYLVGSRRFDPDDDEWACCDDYTPREKYFPLPAETVNNARDCSRVRGRVAAAVREFLAAPDNRDSFLARAAAVAVGFDDGDLVRVK